MAAGLENMFFILERSPAMTYKALYRQWRPRAFNEIVGQPHVSRTLHNAIATGRLSHAYLFCGPRGTGKTSTAKILAKAVNCDGSGTEPCNACSVCAAIDRGASMDVVEIDAASNRGIDEMRDLKEKIRFSPGESRFRVYIIDEVHMLTNEAFNALLKTLEEPPRHILFILATTEPHKVPLTVLSRCQRHDFRPVGQEDIQTRLREVVSRSGLAAEPGALQVIARIAEGSLRDALGVLDQAATMGNGEITLDGIHQLLGTVHQDMLEELSGHLLAARAAEMLRLVSEVQVQGKDLRLLARDLGAHLRGVLYDLVAGAAVEKKGFGRESLIHALEIITRAEQDMRWSTQPGTVFELALLRAMEPDRVSLIGLARRVELLESARLSQEDLSLPVSSITNRSLRPAEKKLSVEGPEPELKIEKKAVRKIVAGSFNTGSSGVETGNNKLSRVEGLWREILREVKRFSPAVNSYLQFARPVGINGNRLTVGFPEGEGELFKGLMTEEENSKLLTRVLNSLLKGQWQVNYICSAELKLAETGEAPEDLSSSEVITFFEGEEVAGAGLEPDKDNLKKGE
ncbi:MAG: DNA polymerase III subunit gamma/tau [Bacillota bacterium]